MSDFIDSAIFSFGEAMNLVKSPKNEEEYNQFATPFPDKKITKTWVEVKNKSDALEADWNAKKYQRDRQYPTQNDQLDMIYWDKVNGTNKWQEAISKVKSDHPKPE